MNTRLFFCCFLCALSGMAFAGNTTDINNTTSPVVSETKSPAPGNPIFDGLSFGGHFGFALFHGDLAEYDVIPASHELRNTFRPAWNLYVKKDLYSGFGAMLQYEKGNLAGGRVTGRESHQVDFKTEFQNLKLMATFNFLNLLSKKELSERKLFLNLQAGIGFAFYRSLSYNMDDNSVRGFVGYEINETNPTMQRFTSKTKTKPANTLNIPVGFTFGYRINYKTDVTINYSFVNLLTDEFDTWSRDFSAQDKYSYIGVGVRFNFNRSSDDYPAKKARANKDKRNNSNSSAQANNNGGLGNLFKSKKDNSSPKDVNMGYPITSQQGSNINENGDNSGELDDIKMKMFELQLKLFEMQYLIDNKGNTNQ